MADMTWGNSYEWPVLPNGVGVPQEVESCALSDNKFVIAYKYAKVGDPGDEEGRVLIGTRVGNVISYGAEVVFSQPIIGKMSLCRLDDDRFVICYCKKASGVTMNLYARVGTVVGDVITFGAEVDLSGSRARLPEACTLSSSKFVVTYNDIGAGDEGTAIVSMVAGNTITPGAPTIIKAGLWEQVDLAKVDTDKVVASWRDHSSGCLLAAVVTVSGTIASMATPLVVDSGSSRWQRIVYLGNDKLMLTWVEGDVYVTYHGLACILTVSGTALSKGDEIETQAAAPAGQATVYPQLVGIGEDNSLFVYNMSSSSGKGTSIWCTVSGTTITLGDKEYWSLPSGTPYGLTFAGETKVVLVYGASGSYYAMVGTCPFRVPTVTTNPATSVTGTSALLHGTLDDAGGESCTCAFDYGLTTSYGSEVEALGTYDTGESFQKTVIGLLPATTYHFRAKATNSEGTGYGDDLTFTTLGDVYPSVGTTRVSSLVHRWVPGSYTLEMVLGGVTSEFGLIIPTGKPAPTIPTLPVCQSDEVLTWSLEKGYYCMKVSDIPPGKY